MEWFQGPSSCSTRIRVGNKQISEVWSGSRVPQVVLPAFVLAINKSLKCGVVPESLKTALVTSVLKTVGLDSKSLNKMPGDIQPQRILYQLAFLCDPPLGTRG